MSLFTISKVETPEDLKDAIFLFQEYAQSLGFDLGFQDFATEMATMPGKYAPPTGSLLLARSKGTGEALGCVGLRQLGPSGICEMKRLYVDPNGRGLGVGKALAKAMIEEARLLGYKAMRLDTLPTMQSALCLYRTFGFEEIGAYYETPLEGTVFLELSLEKNNAAI